MGTDDRAFRDGAAAWDRLLGWLGLHGSAVGADRPRAAEGALPALEDIGVVRHALERAEFSAVREARGRGASWAEIASRLGVTRQSAWERWRDVDEPRDEARAGETVGETVASASSAPAEVLERAATEARRRATVVVPSVVGLSLREAGTRLHERGLDVVVAEPSSRDPDAVVTDQSPEAGARLPRAGVVTLWTGRGGGGAGVREPRRPRPDPLAAREERELPEGDAVH